MTDYELPGNFPEDDPAPAVLLSQIASRLDDPQHYPMLQQTSIEIPEVGRVDYSAIDREQTGTLSTDPGSTRQGLVKLYGQSGPDMPLTEITYATTDGTMRIQEGDELNELTFEPRYVRLIHSIYDSIAGEDTDHDR